MSKKFSSHNAGISRGRRFRLRKRLKNGSNIPGMCDNTFGGYHMGGSNVMANYLTNMNETQHKNLDTGEYWQ